MQYISEFTPLELIIITDIFNMPEHYEKLLAPYVKQLKKKNLQNSVRIIHWEWYYDYNYYLIIDINFNPGTCEQGIICMDDHIIFINNNQKLIVQDKNSPLFLRLDDFQHVRKIDDECTHMHCISTRNIIEELHQDLSEEDVSEEEYNKLSETYVHYSSDDASSLSNDADESSDTKEYEYY